MEHGLRWRSEGVNVDLAGLSDDAGEAPIIPAPVINELPGRDVAVAAAERRRGRAVRPAAS